MPDYRGHVTAGAMSYGVLAFAAYGAAQGVLVGSGSLLAERWWEIPAQLVVAVLAALWPDVDITSRGRKLYYRLFLALDGYLILSGRWKAAAIVGLAAIALSVGRHRGWTHRMWAAMLVPAPIAVIPIFVGPEGSFSGTIYVNHAGAGLPYYAAAVVGYVSHLAADGMLGKSVGRIFNLLLSPLNNAGSSARRDHGRV